MSAPSIIFSCESRQAAPPPIKRRMVNQWLKQVAESYGKEIGEINYIFCDDKYIKKLNNKTLKHNYETDILTFEHSVGDLLFADIVISLETVRDNAEYYQEPYIKELLRVIVHGLLHLCGPDDLTDAQKQEMRAAEEKALSLLPEDLSEVWRKNAITD